MLGHLLLNLGNTLNNGAFINYCNSQVMKCGVMPLCYNDYWCSQFDPWEKYEGACDLQQRPWYQFFGKTCLKVAFSRTHKMGELLVKMTTTIKNN
jgi:hypothetical protein